MTSNSDRPVPQRPPLLRRGHSMESVTDKIASIVLRGDFDEVGLSACAWRFC